MSRHLWTVVLGSVMGVAWVAASGGAAWAQQPGASPSGNNQNTQRSAADFVNNGRGSVAPAAGQDLIHVPSWTPKGPPPGPQGSQGEVIVMTDDPGIWDEKSWISWWETNRDSVLKRVMVRRGGVAAPAAADTAPPEEKARAVAALMKATQAERPALRAAAAVSLGQMRQADALKRLIEMGQKDPDAYVRGMAWLSVGLLGGADAEKALVSVRAVGDRVTPPAAARPAGVGGVRKPAQAPAAAAVQKAPEEALYPKDMFESVGAVMGIGMLDRPGEPALQRLRGMLANGSSTPREIQRAAVWALRMAHNPADHDLLLTMAKPTVGWVPLRSDALLALGAFNDARDVEFLADVASDGRAATAPDREVVTGGGGAYNRQPTNRAGAPLTPLAGSPSTLVRRQQQQQADSSRGSGWKQVDRLSATLALGPGESGRAPAAGNPRVQNALIQNFAPYLNQGGPIFGGASVIAFAASAAPKDVLLLRALLDMGTDPIFTGMVNPRSPLRGYAAIGIGLYLANGGVAKIETRPIGSVQIGIDPGLPDYIDLNETLAQRFSNRQEMPDLRAACALALGLSGDPANAQRLLKGAATINRNDELLLGYTSLALAMLKDPSAFNAAGPLVSGGASKLDPDAIATRGVGHLWAAPSTPKTAGVEPSPFDAPAVPQTGAGMMGVLGRRAALLALSILDDPKSEAVLAGAWGRDEASVQDVARAMGWCKAYKPAAGLAQIVERDQKGAVEAAMSLGWVFDPDHPSRLSKLVVGNNYHEPQADWVEGLGSSWMVRNFPRVADSYLYSTALGGQPIAVHRVKPATRRTTTP